MPVIAPLLGCAAGAYRATAKVSPRLIEGGEDTIETLCTAEGVGSRYTSLGLDQAAEYIERCEAARDSPQHIMVELGRAYATR